MDIEKIRNVFTRLFNNPIQESVNLANYFIEKIKYFICYVIKIQSYFIVYEGHNELLKYLDNKKNGFFIECGGNNGRNFDPTYYLEKMLGWKGIIIEPLPIYKECSDIRRNSKVYNFALVENSYPKKEITIIECNMMSIVKGVKGYKNWTRIGEKTQKIKAKEITVPASTLNKIVQGYFSSNETRKIDLLVIDTECYEINVLQGFDLNRYEPQMILIEIQDQSKKKFIANYLSAKYKLISKIGYNDYLYQLQNPND